MSRDFRLAALLSVALGLAGCYYGPTYPAYGGYANYGYGWLRL